MKWYATFGGSLRGSVGEETLRYCPITCVLEAKGLELMLSSGSLLISHGHLLRMSTDDSDFIAEAADADWSDDDEGEFNGHPLDELKAYHAKLREICGVPLDRNWYGIAPSAANTVHFGQG